MKCMKWDDFKGWKKHQGFGLRQEWVAGFLRHYPDWQDKVPLGIRQVESLQVWAVTGGLEERKGVISPLGELFMKEGAHNLFLWQLFWVKTVFSFPTARWYVHQGTGRFDYAALKEKMKKEVPRLRERTVYDALVELTGLFRHTPIGADLGQGEIKREEGADSRYCIERRGIVPDEKALLAAMAHLFAEERRLSLNIEEDLTWPWTVFGCDREAALAKIFCSSWELLGFDSSTNTVLWQGKEGELEKWRTLSILTI